MTDHQALAASEPLPLRESNFDSDRIELAARLDDRQWELRARLGLVVFLHRRGDFKGAMEGTKKIESLVTNADEPAALAMTKSVKSASLFFRAGYATALELARQAHGLC